MLPECAKSSLGKIGDPEAVGPLSGVLLEDNDWEVRERASGALGRIGHPKAVDPLAHALYRDDDHDVRAAAADALRAIGTPEALEIFNKDNNSDVDDIPF